MSSGPEVSMDVLSGGKSKLNVVFRVKRYMVHSRQDQSLSRKEALEVSKPLAALLPQRCLEPELLYPRALCLVLPATHSILSLPGVTCPSFL